MKQIPIDASYWVIPDRLLAGEYPGAKRDDQAREKLRKFLAAGVSYFVDLTEQGEGLKPYAALLAEEAAAQGREVVHQRMAIRDLGVPSRGQMKATLDAIDAALAQGHTVYVHCWGGVGRTGTVVGCHLVRRGEAGKRALARLRELFATTSKRDRPSPETEAQVGFVRGWSEPYPVPAAEPGSTLDRCRGALLGLAAGDALGTTLEFTGPGPHDLTDMIGGGPFRLRAGEWTDDTSMALCLAASLVEQQAFEPTDQLARYVRWWRQGYLSSNGRCFDIGGATRGALAQFERTGEPYCGSEDPHTAGNGSIMRLAPVPLFFARSPVEAVERSGESSRTTHGAREAVDACRFLGGLIASAVTGASKDELLRPNHAPAPGYWDEHPLAPAIAAIAAGSFKEKSPPAIRGKGYVVPSLEAALWAFHQSESFREGALLAVNLGEDADTTGAVYGQLAGACYGQSGIPPEWLERLAERELITTLADRLHALALESSVAEPS